MCQPVGVLRLASQREHGLSLDVTYLGDGAGGTVALGDKYRGGGLQFGIAARVAVMHRAVQQLIVVQVNFFGFFACLACDAGHCLAAALAFLYLVQDDIGYVKVAVQVVVQFALDKVAYEFGHRRSAFFDVF